MKELDVLLERFLEIHQSALEAGQWPELERLLEAEDDRLWDWLQKPDDPTALVYANLLNQIRHVR